MYDIVIIGGNLSGASAGINAALRDVSIALVEQNKQPFSHAHCGECIPDLTAQWLNLDKIGCKKNEIHKTKIKIGSKEFIFKMRKYKMIVFDRNYIEKKLLEKIEEIGVKLFLGTKMINFKPPNKVILDNDEIIKGKVIIDASGIACQVGRRIGVNTKLKKEDIGVCIQSGVQSNFDSNVIEFWHHEPYAPLGYGWIFPKSETIANIGLGIPAVKKYDLDKLLKKYISDMTNGDYKILNTFKDCLPQAPPISPLVKDNVMIVGDAARLVNAPIGAGIGNAIFSGSLAGIIAARYLCREIPSLQIYEESLKKKIKRLIRGYSKKDRAINDGKMYYKTFGKGLSMFSRVNRFLPIFSEKIVASVLERDKQILEKNQGTPVLL